MKDADFDHDVTMILDIFGLVTAREQAEELKRTLQSLQGERDDRAATLAEKERRIEGYKSKAWKAVLKLDAQGIPRSQIAIGCAVLVGGFNF